MCDTVNGDSAPKTNKGEIKVLEQPCNTSNPGTCLHKENIHPLNNYSDISLYGNPNLDPAACHDNPQRRRPLEDQDPNSQDSGYASGCLGAGNKYFRSSQHLRVASHSDGPPTNSLSKSFKSLNSLDDDFLEFCDLEQSLKDNSDLPSDFNTLISGSFAPAINSVGIPPGHDLPIQSIFKKSGLANAEGGTPNSSRIRCLTKTSNTDVPLIPSKKFKKSSEEALMPVSWNDFSVTEESIKSALQRSSTEPNLIGDFSKPYCLPLISGRNQDLKSISSSTLTSLIKGDFNNAVTSYQIIDCRYPYEYEGGHISGAINIYRKDQLLEKLLHTDSQKYQILVFHCEFSSNRGPSLCRFLRNCDRNCNKHIYPALHYPEMYLLEGGYKNFFEQYTELCVPKAYIPMNHPTHHDDFLHFKEKSKAWGAERQCLNNQGSLKRLSFI